MATLNEVMKETADAIREKTGKSDLIAPVNFATEIKGITAGGGSGGSNIEYFDVSEVENKVLTVIPSALIKSDGKIFPTGEIAFVALAEGEGAFFSKIASVNQVAVDVALEISEDDGFISLGSLYDDPSISRITREQFYTLE